jgi:glutamate synthase (NADPH/NADH) large chain
LEYTGSNKAAEIIDNWEKFRPKFVKVMPIEYRRALEEIEAVQNAGIVAAE